MTKHPDDRARPRAAERSAPGEGVARPENAGRVIERVQAIVEPIAAAHRCEVISVELRREPVGLVLRLYVEKLGHDPRMLVGGVTLEDCTAISRDVSAALDVHDVVEHAYHLEVSSPGLERPLVKAADYARFAGLRARLHLSEPSVAGQPTRKSYKGEILAADEREIRLRDDDVGEIAIPFASVHKANLVYEAPAKPKPGKQAKHASPKKQKLERHVAETTTPKGASAEPRDAEGTSSDTHTRETGPQARRS